MHFAKHFAGFADASRARHCTDFSAARDLESGQGDCLKLGYWPDFSVLIFVAKTLPISANPVSCQHVGDVHRQEICRAIRWTPGTATYELVGASCICVRHLVDHLTND